jgi:hypothetical protein
MPIPTSLIRLLALLLTTDAVSGCVAINHTYPRNASGAALALPAAPVAAPATFDSAGHPLIVTGVWRGVSHADCSMISIGNPGRCGATQNIVLTMLQQGDSVSGFYKCAFGTEVCRNLDEDGVIRNGKIQSGRLMIRVMLQDGSMCFFTGRPLQGVIQGRYSCLQGAGVVERGAFRTELSF